MDEELCGRARIVNSFLPTHLDFGILIANNGITGNADDLNAAHNTIAFHLAQKRKVIVITRAEINALTNTNQLIHLIKEKICLLSVAGRIA